ncbi:unnamed protein product, partial [Allacma fusca]
VALTLSTTWIQKELPDRISKLPIILYSLPFASCPTQITTGYDNLDNFTTQ